MNDERSDFAARLRHIESQATMAAEDLPRSVLKDRILDIAVTARLLRLRLEVAADKILRRGG